MSGSFMVPIQAGWSSVATERSGAQPGNASQSLSLAPATSPPGFTLLKDDAVGSPLGTVTVPQFFGSTPDWVQIFNDATGTAAWTSRGAGAWYFIETATNTVVRSAQTVETCQPGGFNIEPATPLAAQITNGTALTGSSGVPNGPDRRSLAFSSATWLLYTDSFPDLTDDLRTLDARLRARDGTTVTPSGVTIRNAGFSGNAVDRIIWVAPGDIGPGADQIPSQLVEVVSDNLENHPSCFLRYVHTLRSVGALNFSQEGYDIEQPTPLINTTPNPDVANFQVRQIDRDPTYCSWRLLIDGAYYTLYLKVPDDAIGARRPRDLYQAIFGAKIGSDGSIDTELFAYDLTVAGTPAVQSFHARSLVRRWQYLQYAQFIAPFDDDPAQIWTDVTPTAA